MELNDKQKLAVEAINGPLLILAGAGTGKTKTIISRISHIIDKTEKPYQIMAVTFTNKATREMKSRLEKMIGPSSVLLGTFHSICVRFLRQYAPYIDLDPSFTIIDQSEKEKIIKDVCTELQIDTKIYPVKKLSFLISGLKDEVIYHHNKDKILSHSGFNETLERVYRMYQGRLLSYGLVDFDDLILYMVKAMQNHEEVRSEIHRKINYILVDEYQDVSNGQNEFLRLLTNEQGNICCVGDEDQSIYGWRGANVDNILNFSKNFKKAEIIRLEQNYRSTNNIIKVAMSVICNNVHRYNKNIFSTIDVDKKVLVTLRSSDQEEAYFIAKKIKDYKNENKNPEEIAILVRAMYQTRVLEDVFNKEGLSYRIVDGIKFYDRKEIKDIIAYLRVIFSNRDLMAFERIINEPKRGIGPKAMSIIKEHVNKDDKSVVSVLESLSEQGEFSKNATKELRKFLDSLDYWKRVSKSDSFNLSDLASSVVNESGYIEMLNSDEKNPEESKQRLENIREFIGLMMTFGTLEAFLEHIALVNSREDNPDEEAVNVLTMHGAKGLEYDTVFLPSWEEGIFPSPKSIDENGNRGLEEERRLAYVSITRAKNNLYISHAKSRFLFGRHQDNVKSRFIGEIEQFSPKDSFERKNYSNYKDANSGQSFYYNKSKKQETGFMEESRNSFQSPSFLGKDDVGNSFKIGDKVIHKTLGEGIVESVMGHYVQVKMNNDLSKRLIHNKFLSFIKN